MRVAVPSDTDQGLESTRSGHFGHSPYFTIATIEDGKVEKVEVPKNVDHDEYGCGGVIQYALSLDIDAIVVLGIIAPRSVRSRRTVASVYIDAMAPTVGAVIDKFIAGDLRPMRLDQACVH